MSPQQPATNKAIAAIIVTASIVAAGYALRHAVSCFLLFFIFAYLIASIVPFVGAAVAVIPPILIGYGQTGDIFITPKICVVCYIINVIIKGNLIKPIVMKHTLRLNPLAVIFALMAMGGLMIFWGIVLAIPLAAVVKICASEFRNREPA